MPLDPSIQLQPHQQRLRDKAEEAARTGTPFRTLGLWSTGSGKTLGALGAVDALGGDATYVVPAALRENLRGEAIRSIGKSPNIYSYQGAVAGKAPATDTLVLDEAQRVTSPGSQQAAAVQSLAGQSKNVIALSGTPIKNDPSEFAPLMSLLTNKNISHEQFKQRYIGKERHRPGGLLGWIRGEPSIERPVLQNTDELKELLKGKIDYYQTEQHSDAANVSYKDVETEMTRRQADLYEGFWNRLPFMMRWKLRHRYDLSPEELLRFKSFMTGPRQVGLSDMPFRTDGNALKAFDDSGKLTAAFKSMQETLADPRRKGIAYSNFVDAGLKPYAAALDRAKIPYGMFSGDMNDQQRRDMVKAFNDGKLRVALVAPAGAEGISLKGSQKIQLLDPYWNDARMRQAQARGIRFDSHTGLPEDLRGVEVERYIAKLPLGLKGRLLAALGVDRESQRATVDDHLRAIAGRKERLNTQFLDLLKEIGTADRLPQSPVNRKGASVTIPGANRYPGAQEGQNVTEKKQPRVRVVMPHGDGQFLMETLSNPKYPERLGMTRFPGGGIEEGETPEQAAAREMREELGAEIDPKAFRSLGVIPHHQWGHDEHYLYLADHGLAPGVFDSAVGGDEQVHLTAGHPSGPKYFGADITSLLGKTSPTGPAQAGGAGLLAIKKIAAGPLSTASPADVYIIRGNPDADPENVGKYDAFYNNVKDHVSSLGYSAEFDSGLPNTVPPGGKFWLGHSRGGDRLRFAPQHGASALRLDDYEPDATRETQNAAYKKLFTQLGVARIADVPVSLRPKPGPEHYTYNDRMRAAVSRLLSTGKSAAYDIAGVGQRHMTVQSAGGADTMAALRMAKQYSDSARWQKKTQILRELMAGAGQDWTVDSDQGHTVGVTHVSGWKFHLPKSQISDLPLFSVWRANQRTA